MEDAVFIVGIGDEISGLFYDRLGVCHSHSETGVLDHGQIVEAVSAADHLVCIEPEGVEELPERVCFIDILGHDLEISRK